MKNIAIPTLMLMAGLQATAVADWCGFGGGAEFGPATGCQAPAAGYGFRTGLRCASPESLWAGFCAENPCQSGQCAAPVAAPACQSCQGGYLLDRLRARQMQQYQMTAPCDGSSSYAAPANPACDSCNGCGGSPANVDTGTPALPPQDAPLPPEPVPTTIEPAPDPANYFPQAEYGSNNFVPDDSLAPAVEDPPLLNSPSAIDDQPEELPSANDSLDPPALNSDSLEDDNLEDSDTDA
ncbi:MAG: hypothetical protein R3E01_23070 [Pirellulaceae bacterium]|nr:hypothetical protein [Planctomycetales bacterium]